MSLSSSKKHKLRVNLLRAILIISIIMAICCLVLQVLNFFETEKILLDASKIANSTIEINESNSPQNNSVLNKESFISSIFPLLFIPVVFLAFGIFYIQRYYESKNVSIDFSAFRSPASANSRKSKLRRRFCKVFPFVAMGASLVLAALQYFIQSDSGNIVGLFCVVLYSVLVIFAYSLLRKIRHKHRRSSHSHSSASANMVR